MGTNNDDQNLTSFLNKAFSGEANIAYGREEAPEPERRVEPKHAPAPTQDHPADGPYANPILPKTTRVVTSGLEPVHSEQPSNPGNPKQSKQPLLEEQRAQKKLKKQRTPKAPKAQKNYSSKQAGLKSKRKLAVKIILIPIVGIFLAIIIGLVASKIVNESDVEIAGRNYRKASYSVYLEDVTLSAADKDGLNKLSENEVISFTNCDLNGLDFNSLKGKDRISNVIVDNCIGVNAGSGYNFSEYKSLRELTIINSGLTMDNLKLPNSAKKAELRELNVSGNEGITDLSFVPLNEVSRLDISYTSIRDLKPLMTTDYFYTLDVSGIDLQAGSNMGVVCGLSNTSELTMNDCNIGDKLLPMKSKYIYKISMANNNITDLSAIADLDKLSGFNVSGNPVKDIPFVDGCKDTLRQIDISYTDVSDETLEAISKCKEVRVFKADGVESLTNLDIVKDMPELETLGVSNCRLKSLDGIENHGELTIIVATHNEIDNISALNSLTKRATCDLRYNNLTSLVDLKGCDLDTLVVSGNDVTLGSDGNDYVLRNGIGIRNLVVDYNEDVMRGSLKSVIGGGNITYICVADAPADVADEYKKIYSVWGSIKSTDDIDNYFDNRDYEQSRYISLDSIGK